MLFQISQTILYFAMDQRKLHTKDDSVLNEKVSVAYTAGYLSHIPNYSRSCHIHHLHMVRLVNNVNKNCNIMIVSV